MLASNVKVCFTFQWYLRMCVDLRMELTQHHINLKSAYTHTACGSSRLSSVVALMACCPQDRLTNLRARKATPL